MFDLSSVQADYILDMPLRRLTRFSRIELEKERDELLATIAALDEILADETRLRGVVSEELAEVAKTFGTPRRTVLLESAGAAAVAAATSPLEVADDPCFVYLSSSGLLARTANADPPGRRRRPGQARRRGLGGPRDRTRRDRRPHLGRPAGQDRRPRAAAAPRHRQRPAPRRRRTRHRGAGPRARRAPAGPVHAGDRGSGSCARHQAGRREAGQPRGARQERLGGDRAQGR